MAYKLRGVPKPFQTEAQALAFLRNSPRYMQRQQTYLRRFWPGLYAKAAPLSGLDRQILEGKSARLRGVPAGPNVFDRASGAIDKAGNAIGSFAEDAVAGLGVVALTGGDPRKVREVERKSKIQTAGLNEAGVLKATRAAGKVAGNFAGEATKMGLGALIAPVAFASDPAGFSKAVAQDTYERYKRLAQGDLGVLAERPAAFLVDAWVGANAVAKAGAKAGIVKAPREAYISVDGGKVQRYTSPATVSRVVENAYNRLSERRPDAPVVGAKHRARQRVITLQERELGHLKQDVAKFSQMARRVKTVGEKMAYDRLHQYGWRTPEERQQALAWVDRELSELRTTGGRPQARTVRALVLAREHIQRPSPRLIETLEEGVRVMDAVERAEIGLGRLAPDTAAARKNVPARLAEGAKFDKETGAFVGAEDVAAGPSAGYLPHTSRGPLKSLAQPARSLTRPKANKRTQGILFTTGRARYGPQLVTEKALKSARDRVVLKNIDDVKTEWAKPWRAGEEIPEGWTIWNPEAVRLPRAARDAFDNPDLTPNEMARLAKSDYAEMIANMFPTTAYAGKSAYIIPEWVAASFRSGQMRMPGYGAAGVYRAVENVVNLANNLFRLRIYIKPSYLTNFFANEATALLKQGPWHAPNLRQAIQATSTLEPSTLARLDELMGTSASVALEGPAGGRGALGGVTTAAGQFMNRLTDRVPRRTAIVHELRKRGAKTDEQINRFLDDPEKRAKLNTAIEEAQNSVGRFEGLGPMEREYLTTAIAVYPWLKAATRWTVRLPWDAPTRAAVVAHAGLEGWEWAGQELGGVAEWLRRYVPLPFTDDKPGQRTVTQVGNVAPLSTGIDVLRAGANTLLGSDRVGEGTNLARLLSPPAAALGQAAYGVTPYGKETGEGLLDTLVGQQSEGGLPRTVKELISPTGETRYFADRGRAGVIEQGLVGPFARRTLKTGPAREAGEDEKLSRLPTKRRSYIRELREEQAKARRLGLKLPRPVVDDLVRKADLDDRINQAEREARKRGRSINYRDRLRLLGEHLGVDFGADVLPEDKAESLYRKYRDFAYPTLAKWREMLSASP